MSKTYKSKTKLEKHFIYDSDRSPRLRSVWLRALALDAEHDRKLGWQRTVVRV